VIVEGVETLTSGATFRTHRLLPHKVISLAPGSAGYAGKRIAGALIAGNPFLPASAIFMTGKAQRKGAQMTKASKADYCCHWNTGFVDCGGNHHLATFDWNRLKPTINQKVSTELNRPLPFAAIWAWWERQKEETGWRSWMPWPHIHADDILLGNPPDIPEVTMVHLPRVEATLPAGATDQNGLPAVDQTAAARCAPDPPV
jgi:hypothetical protein